MLEIYKNNRNLVWLLLFLAFAMYGQALTNWAITIDNEVTLLYRAWNEKWFTSCGRWGVYFFKNLFALGSYVPFISIFWACVFLCLSSVLYSHVLFPEDRKARYVFGVLLVTFVQFAYIFQFRLQADVTAFGLFLLSLSFYYYQKWKTGKWWFLLPIIACLTFSFSIYQSLLFTYASMFVVYVLVNYTARRTSLKATLFDLVRGGLLAGFGFLLNTVIGKILLISMGESSATNSYQKSLFLWNGHSFKDCLTSIGKSCMSHLSGMVYTGERLFPLVFFAAFGIAVYVFKRNNIKASLAAFLLSLTAILSVCGQDMALGGAQFARVYTGQGFVFAGLIALSVFLWKNISTRILTPLLFIVVIHNSYICNNLFFNDELHDKHEQNLAHAIKNDIELLEGFQRNKTKVAIMGKYVFEVKNTNKDIYEHRYDKRPSQETFLARFFSDGCPNGRAHSFFRIYGIADYERPSQEQLLAHEDKIKDMPSWPDKKSIQMLGDIVVVKLSDDYDLMRY